MKFITLMFALLFPCIMQAQAPAIEWQKSLGGSTQEQIGSIQQTNDGGYIVVGGTFSTNGDITVTHGIFDYWVVKLSFSGSVEWQKSLGGTGLDLAHSIQQTSDGGYIIAGQSNSNDGDVTGNHGGYDYWIVKLTSSGVIEWEKSYGGSKDEIAYSIQQTKDGGYIVSGQSNSNDDDVTGNHGSYDYWIVKLTSSGVIEWEKSLGGSSGEWATSICQTSDGGYIVAGSSRDGDGEITGSHGGWDYWIVKLTSTGSMEWQKSLGGSNDEQAESIRQTKDGGYIVAGASYSNDGDVSGNHGSSDAWIVKLTSSGVMEWQKSFGGSNDEQAKSICQTSDGGYMVACNSGSKNGDVTGNHDTPGKNTWDFWLVKLTSYPSDVNDAQSTSNAFNIKGNFPNPAQDRTEIEFNIPNSGKVSIVLYDNNGKIMQTLENQSCSAGNNSMTWNCRDLNGNRVPNGIFFYEVRFGNEIQKKKMVVVE